MNTPTLDDVLDAFAMEGDYGHATLERYLRLYPHFATELVDLSRQLDRPPAVDTGPLSQHMVNRIHSAWQAHVAAHSSPLHDPLAAIDLSKNREIAKLFDLPRQVITALCERRVKVDSIPRSFLVRLAAELSTTAEALTLALSQPRPQLSHGYKSEEKPVVSEPVSFEQLLVDANVPLDRRRALLSEGA